MRKSLPILVCLLGLFFLLPFISYSRAVPPEYVGVQVGEEYPWTLRVNVDTYEEYATDLNMTVPPEISMYETMGGIQLKGVVSWISDEIVGLNYSYVLVNLTIYMNVPGYGWMAYPDPAAPEPLPVFLLSNNTANYFNTTMAAMEVESAALPPPIPFALPFIIVPVNLDWEDAVQGLNETMMGFSGGMAGITIEVEGNGFRITIPEQMVNGSLVQEMNYVAQWNSKGVFSLGQVLYGGATLMSVNVPEGEIPGYELPIILGVLGVTTIGLVYYKKKKR